LAITSSHPFRAYVYNDIVLRFCPAQYVDPVVDPAVSITPLFAPIPSFLLPFFFFLFLHFFFLYIALAVIDPAVSLTPLTAPIPSFLLPPVPSFLVPDDHHFLFPHVPSFILPHVPFFLLLYTVLAVVDPAVSLTPLTAPVPSFLLPLVPYFFLPRVPSILLFYTASAVVDPVVRLRSSDSSSVSASFYAAALAVVDLAVRLTPLPCCFFSSFPSSSFALL